ncbi:hypothetical protein BgiBS90_005285 [Biomphalaria glabrata]|nr:hypothetical protein BgiBS90_005285 [Biomphalaria glabrata]
MLSASLSSLIRAKRSVLLIACVSTLFLYTFYNNIASWSLSQTETRAETEELLEGEFKSCPNVISRMVVGHWVRHKDYSKKEMTLVDDALRKTLRHNKISGVLERKDKRCGNVDLEGNPYYRALCEPEGETPCCFSYTCVNKTIDQCQGPWALDVRQVFQAEFATWIPDDPTCKMLDLRSEKQICQVLDNVTIYFVGESLTRMLYMSLLGLLRDQKYETHILIDNSTTDRGCHVYLRYSPPCKPFIMRDSVECNGKTRLRFKEALRPSDVSEMLRQLKELSGIPNTFYVSGFGFHDRFKADPVISKVFNPIFQELANATWPKFIWLATHMPTILQTTTSYMQQPPEILAYNAALKTVLSAHKVPVMDWTQLTANVMGIDNLHYGKGVNDVKAVILLNLLLELRHNSSWMLEKQIPDNIEADRINLTVVMYVKIQEAGTTERMTTERRDHRREGPHEGWTWTTGGRDHRRQGPQKGGTTGGRDHRKE